MQLGFSTDWMRERKRERGNLSCKSLSGASACARVNKLCGSKIQLQYLSKSFIPLFEYFIYKSAMGRIIKYRRYSRGMAAVSAITPTFPCTVEKCFKLQDDSASINELNASSSVCENSRKKKPKTIIHIGGIATEKKRAVSASTAQSRA